MNISNAVWCAAMQGMFREGRGFMEEELITTCWWWGTQEEMMSLQGAEK